MARRLATRYSARQGGKAGEGDEPLFSQQEMKIKYPSDSLTLGYIRAREPDSHSNRGGKIVEDDAPIGIDKILWWEEGVAFVAFHRAASGRMPTPEEKELAPELARMYVEYGMASGLRAAEEMVRSIESQAAALAKGRRH